MQTFFKIFCLQQMFRIHLIFGPLVLHLFAQVLFLASMLSIQSTSGYYFLFFFILSLLRNITWDRKITK